jgi:5-methylcytosine-specific restriction enzyme subunit McrC
LFKKGLYKSYIPKHESLVGLRGKVILPLNMRPSPRLWCDYDELSYATAENRLIKGSLFLLLQLPLSFRTHQRALSYIRLLGDVDALPLQKENVALIRYNRLNEHYRIILELCALLSNQTVLRDEAGERFFSGYMMDMDMVFQYFILRVLQKWLAEESVSSGRKSAWAQALQSDSYLPVIEPDIVIRNRLVIDTKYYKGPLNANNKYHSDNLAQIHFYMQAYGLNGMLVYPQMNTAFDHTYQFKGLEFSILTFPLDVESSQVEDAIQKFVGTLMAHFSVGATELRDTRTS